MLKTDQMESASIFGGETGSKGVIHNAQGESFTPLKDAANAKPEPERNDTMKSTINQEGPVTQAGKYVIQFRPQHAVITVVSDEIADHLSRK